MDREGGHSERRRAAILAAGVDILATDPASFSARAVGRRLGITHGAILYHYARSIDRLRDAVAAEAIRTGNGRAVAYLIVSRHPAAAALSEVDRSRYLASC